MTPVVIIVVLVITLALTKVIKMLKLCTRITINNSRKSANVIFALHAKE